MGFFEMQTCNKIFWVNYLRASAATCPQNSNINSLGALFLYSCYNIHICNYKQELQYCYFVKGGSLGFNPQVLPYTNLEPYTPLVLTSVFPSFSVTCLCLTCSDIGRFNSTFVFIVFVSPVHAFSHNMPSHIITLYIKYSMICIFCLFLVLIKSIRLVFILSRVVLIYSLV